MKGRKPFALLVVVSLFASPSFIAAQNYYELIGARANMPRHEIRRQCVLKESEVKITRKQLDTQNKKVQQLKSASPLQLKALKEAKDEQKRLQRLIDDLQKKMPSVTEACQVLQDPTRKAEYDRQLAQDAADEREREKKLREALKKEEAQVEATAKEEEKKGGIFAKIEGGIKRGIESAKRDSDVLISKLAGELLSKIKIPNAATKVFNQNLAMRNMSIIKVPTGANIRKGIGFTGTMFFNNFGVKGTMFVVETEVMDTVTKQKKRTIQYSLAMELPEAYKISSMFPKFKKLDALSLPKGKFVLSSFAYVDPDGYSIKDGFNFVASLKLAGPLKLLNDLKNRARKLRSIIVTSEPIRFQGVIPVDITKTEFSATIPLRLGIDFTKISSMPKSITNIFKQITTDDFVFVVTAPPKLTFTFEGGVRLVLGTQPDPIRLSMFGLIEPTSFSLGIRMRNLLELKWIALGNAGIQLDFDEVLLPVAAALGVPFTGIGVNGQIDVGKAGPSRAVFKVAGGVRVSGTKIPDIVFDVEATNIKFASIIALLSKIAAKAKVGKEISVGSIPTMTINRVKGYMALEDTKIAQKEYKAGFGLQLDAQLFDHRVGFAVDIKTKELKMSGSGYMSNIDLKIGNKRIFSLTGPGPDGAYGTPDDGPVVYCMFDVRKPLGGTFGIRGMLDMPIIGIKQKVDLEVADKKFKVDLETTNLGFTVLFGVNIDPKKWKEMFVKFGFKGDFGSYLSKYAKPAIDQLRREASAKLAKVDQEIAEFSQRIRQLRSKGVKATEQEIRKTRDTISRINEKIQILKKKCSNASLIKKTYICPKVGIEITAQSTAKRAQQVYLELLLKPGKRVVEGITKVIEVTTKAIADAQILRRSVGALLGGLSAAFGVIAKGLSIFKLTEAIGQISAAEVAQGKMPKLISFIVEVNIPKLPSVRISLQNLQFDFKNPKKSAGDIAKKLVTGIKVG